MAFNNSEKDKKSRIYIFLIILVLLLVNGLLIYKLIQREKDNTRQEEQIEDFTEDKARLEEMLNETELQLDDYKGKNAELDSIILVKNGIISNKVDALRKAIKSNKLDRSQIRRLEDQIRALNGEMSEYRAQVDSLSQENKYLMDEVYAQTQEIEQKTKDIKTRDEVIDEQSKTIAKGSVLQLAFVKGVGIKDRRNGKEKETDRLGGLNAADKIRISMVVDKNPIAEKGPRTAYVQIITPNGSTLHNESAGSGKLTHDGEATLYTAKKAFTFNNKNEELEFNWPVGPSMTEGTYMVNVYCEEKLIGKTKFDLR